jgi:hypothetical protein
MRRQVMIPNTNTDCDPDSDPDIEDYSRSIPKFRVTTAGSW